MSKNLSQDKIENRFSNTMIETIKRTKEQRMNQFVLLAVVAPTLLNSWVNYGAPFANAGYYREENGIVHLTGVVKSGTMSSAIFTLPAGYRPTATLAFPVMSNDAFGEVRVDSSGNVTPTVGSNLSVSLDGIAFRTT